MNYLKAMKDDIPCMSTNNSFMIKWHINATFAIHKDMKSHTGATMSLGSGTICSISTKQKSQHMQFPTEAELVGFNDIISKILWLKLAFWQESGGIRLTDLLSGVYRFTQWMVELPSTVSSSI